MCGSLHLNARCRRLAAFAATRIPTTRGAPRSVARGTREAGCAREQGTGSTGEAGGEDRVESGAVDSMRERASTSAVAPAAARQALLRAPASRSGGDASDRMRGACILYSGCISRRTSALRCAVACSLLMPPLPVFCAPRRGRCMAGVYRPPAGNPRVPCRRSARCQLRLRAGWPRRSPLCARE